MILGKKIKIPGKLHGGVSITAVCHKSAKNIILKSEENICASVIAFARISHLPRRHPSTSWKMKEKKNKEKKECGMMNKLKNTVMILIV
jgi:hypothetical protein